MKADEAGESAKCPTGSSFGLAQTSGLGVEGRMLTRRQFIAGSGMAGLLMAAPFGLAASKSKGERLDRQGIVRRHNPHFTRFDPFSCISVGNGEFAFTADITGLQTFTDECRKDFPLCTASHWGWHSTPGEAGFSREALRLQHYDVHGRKVPYPTNSKGQEPLFNWLRQNPHRLHLGRLGFAMVCSDGGVATPAKLAAAEQRLDMWTGLLDSRFSFEDSPVHVQTCCHPELDLVAVRIESPLLKQSKLPVVLAFPYGSPNVDMADWNQPGRHSTTITPRGDRGTEFARRVDQFEYYVRVIWSRGGRVLRQSEHQFVFETSSDALELVVHFSPQPGSSRLPDFRKTCRASEKAWSEFWSEGGALEFEGSTAVGAAELERRVVLSLYQTAIHCAGSLPSAETGLLFNSWYGKFHLEMHWWHSVHFTAWNRFKLFERSLGVYEKILPIARETARSQGYEGARWPKMVGPDGHDSPSPVGPLLIWQQPHPIYYAELCYRQHPTRATLQRWRDVVFESARFMASFACQEPSGRWILGPVLKTVSENTEPLTTINPTFELAYWRFGLRVAQTWRERLGLARDPQWDRVLHRLAPLPVQDSLYLMQEGMTDTFTKFNWEHPALVGAFGMQPGDGVDPDTMKRTVRLVMDVWQWEKTWGWDFPMMAMAAARTGEPELAVKALLLDVPKNRYWPNGHNYQRPGLTAYLPGNGGLLAAVAMMAAGWAGAPNSVAPGFPSAGWHVRHEGLRSWL